MRVTAANSAGSASADSAQTQVITGSTSVSPPVNTSPPAISGSAQQGQTLSASAGSWSNSPTSFAYQWRRCSSSGSSCTDIASATSTSYTLQAADVGATLRMRVTAANSAGSASADSAQTQVVTAAGSGGGGGGGGGGGSGAGMAAPTSSAAPTITGLARQGGTLSASTGSWSGNPTGYSYRWSQCDHAGSSCAPIGGATSSSYQVAKADVGSTLRVSVTATNAGGAGTATSAPTAQVSALAPTVLARPVIRGTLRVGKTLLAGGDRWTEALTRRSYTWLRCGPRGGRCVAIAGARSRSYKLRAADLHHAMRVSVTVWTTGGSAKSVSFATAAVRR